MRQNVIDMFTRKPVRTGEAVRKPTPHDIAKFVGSVDKTYASEVLKNASELKARREQLDALYAAWEADYEMYEVDIDDIHVMMDVEDYSEEEYTFILDTEGHGWLVPNDRLGEFIKMCNGEP